MSPRRARKKTAVSAESSAPVKPAEGAVDRAIRDLELFKQHLTSLQHHHENLDAQIRAASEAPLSREALRLLVYLFNAEALGHRDIGVMTRKLNMERQAVQEHLSQLHERGLAQSEQGRHRLGHLYWALTPQGRQFAIDHKFCSAPVRPPAHYSRMWGGKDRKTGTGGADRQRVRIIPLQEPTPSTAQTPNPPTTRAPDQIAKESSIVRRSFAFAGAALNRWRRHTPIAAATGRTAQRRDARNKRQADDTKTTERDS